MSNLTLQEAINFAKSYAQEGLRTRPHDQVFVYTLQQIALIEEQQASPLGLQGLPPDSIHLGMMAVKELGSDEQDFAHALHVIQRAAEAATGERKGV